MLLGALTWFTGDMSAQNGLDWLKNILIAVVFAFVVIRWPLTEPYKIPSQSMFPALNGDPRFLRGDRVFVNKFVYGVRVPFMNKRLWHGAEPQRWEIVVFKSPDPNAEHSTLIKRIVGLPGERIHIAQGKIHVNGQAVDMPTGAYYTRFDPPLQPGERREGVPPETLLKRVQNLETHIERQVDAAPAEEREKVEQQLLKQLHVVSASDMRYGVLTENPYALIPEGHYLVLGDNSMNSRDGRYYGWVPNENIVGRAYCIWWPLTHWRDFTGFSHTWWWHCLVTLVGVLMVLRLFLGRSWRVPHRGLADSLAPGEHVFINRCAYGWPVPASRMRVTRGRAPRRGEIVLYRSRADETRHSELLLGRIAGLPGEKVYFAEGKLLVNGEPVTDVPALADKVFSSNDGAGPYGRSKGKEFSQAPDEHYFILCDNAEDSVDGRALGWTARQDLIGPASAVWWPLTKWRRVKP